MKLQSTYTIFTQLGKHRYEVIVDTYKTIKEIYIRRAGWAMGNTIRLRGADFKVDELDYLREHIAEIDFCYNCK